METNSRRNGSTVYNKISPDLNNPNNMAENKENESSKPVVPPLKLNQPKTSAHVPFVYFVVAENKPPIQVSQLEGTGKTSDHAIKARKHFLNEKKRRLKFLEETKKRIQQQNLMVGLCLGPMKDDDNVSTVSTSGTKDLYPMYKLSEKTRPKPEVRKQTRFSGIRDHEGFQDPGSVTPVESVKKANSIINLELSLKEGKNKPIRIPSATDFPSEKDQPKRVQFSECSFYQDNEFPRRGSSKASRLSRRSRSVNSLHEDSYQNRSLEKPEISGSCQTTSRSHHGNRHELPLPKVDLMNDMFDDVIIKAIDTYMTSRNVSAKRRPEMERRLISRLAMSRRYQMEVDAKIREHSATTRSRLSSANDHDISDEEEIVPYRHVPLKPTAFHMVAPGTQIGMR